MAVALLFPVQALAVSPARGWGLLWAVPVSAGARFQLNWIHTVTRRPITETYEIELDGRLHLVEMVFDQYGPNLPAGPEEGTTWRIERDRWVVTGYSLRTTTLNLGVGPFGHALEVAGHRWDMLAGAGADRLVRLEVKRVPIGLILLAEGYQWRNTNRF
ncbi:MAG: DUF1850 domain-containing protein [Mycobacterium leprae]